jgi:hypothetical protein
VTKNNWQKDAFGPVKVYKSAKTAQSAQKTKQRADYKKQAVQQYYDHATTATAQALAQKVGVQYNDAFRQATESYFKNKKVMDDFRQQSVNESNKRQRDELKASSSFKVNNQYKVDEYNAARKKMGMSQDNAVTQQKYNEMFGYDTKKGFDKGMFNRLKEYQTKHPDRVTVQQPVKNHQNLPFKKSPERIAWEKQNKPTSNGVGSSFDNFVNTMKEKGKIKKDPSSFVKEHPIINNILSLGGLINTDHKDTPKKDKDYHIGKNYVNDQAFGIPGLLQQKVTGKLPAYMKDKEAVKTGQEMSNTQDKVNLALGVSGIAKGGVKQVAKNLISKKGIKTAIGSGVVGATAGELNNLHEKQLGNHLSKSEQLKNIATNAAVATLFGKALGGHTKELPKELPPTTKKLLDRTVNKGKITNPKKIEAIIKPETKISGEKAMKIEALDPTTAPLAEKIVPVNDHIPYKKGDPLPDTLGHIDTKTKKNLLNIKELSKKGYIKGIDNLHSLNQFDKTVESVLGKKLKPTESTYTLGLNSRGSDQISKQILTEKMVDKNGEVVGNSLKDIASQIPKKKEKLFEDYLINKHAITRMNRGEKVFPDEMKMNSAKSEAKVLEYEKQHPEFKGLANQYYEYNKQLGEKWLVDTGILSKDQWKGYLEANPHYVPNQRIFDSIERPTFSNGAKKGFAGQTNPIKKGVGSQRKIVSPLESTIEHTDKYIKTAKRNEVMQTFIHNISQDPEAFKGIAEIVPTKNTPTDIMDTLHKDGVEGLMDELNVGFDQKPDLSKGNVVTGIVDGQKVHVRVHDPELLDSITNLAPKAQHTVVKAVGQLTRITKNLTTGINPVFSLTRNIFRDIPTAYINSKTTNNPVVFGKDLVGSLVSVLKNDDLYRSFKAVGGGHSSPISSDVNLLAQSKNEILGKNNLKSLLSKGIGKIENLNNALESAPRLAEYKRITKNDNSYDAKMKGLFEANDVTVNFNKYGNVAKEVDAFIPYMNAALQGLDKTVRTFKDNPVKASVKAFTAITIPSIVLYTINHKDPNYQNLSDYVKDNNFLIPKGDGTFIKIPKPRELGVLFGSDVERTLRAWSDHDPEAFAKFSDTIQDNFYPPTRTILHPVLKDLPSNKNFNNAPIVPGDLQNLSPRYQYDGRTSEPAKFIGNLTNISPKKLDYLAQSYGGVLSELGVPLTTKGGSVGDTLKQKVTADPTFSNDALRNFYDEKTKLDQAHNDYVKQGVQSKNLNEPLRLELNRRSRQIGDIRKIMKQVQNNNSISDKERNDKVKKLQEQINNLAKMPRR